MPVIISTSTCQGAELEYEDGETVMLEEPNTKLYLGDEDKGNGKLVLSNKQVLWISNEQPDSNVVSIDYPYITMHAICRDTEAFSEPCIYCQLNPSLEESSEGELNEVRFAPDDEESLEKVFKVFSECSALHPDEPEDDGDDHGQTQTVFGFGAAASGDPVGAPGVPTEQSIIQHLDSLLLEPPRGPVPFEENQFSD